MAEPPPLLDTSHHNNASSSSRPSPISGLTTFPNPFADEPEPGLLPSLLTKVKNTFAAASSSNTAQSRAVVDKDKGPEERTEAQAIAEAARKALHARRQSGGAAISTLPVPLSAIPSESSSVRPSPTSSLPPVGSGSRALKPPTSSITGSALHSQPPSIASSSLSQAPIRRLVPPGERQWRPSGAAPAQVTISPVTSVTTTTQSHNTNSSPSNDDVFPTTAIPHKPPLRAHFGLQSVVTSTSSPRPYNPLHHHAHSRSLGGRPRRSSIATIPDSPSSISLSAMIAANAALSGNVSHVPGFPINQDDTRSVKSLGFVKKTNSVSRLIRRMRGEGLSKHYWMADEHCKECYDCKSVSSLSPPQSVWNSKLRPL
jgi:1-phosphatidylinositol-3-phosphate 5-kinase